jgi:predicted ATP-dependent endonuclease of OLD family
MKLKRFKVQMFKCILDSGWIDLINLTVLVGKNEAGKTSLLRALHKFNPFEPEPYSIAREWPRGHRGERSDSQVVCSAEFELNNQDLSDLKQITTGKLDSKSLIVTRDYAGRFEVLFPEALFPEKLHPNDLDKLCDSLPFPPADVHPDFTEAAKSCRAEAVRLAREGRFSNLETLANQHEPRLTNRSPQNPQINNENAFRSQYIAQLRQLGTHLQAAPATIHRNAHEYVIRALPAFVYMDEYSTFNGTAALDQVKQRKDQNRLTDDDQTLITILRVAGLDLDQEVRKATEQDRGERQYDLDDAAATLNRKIENHWKQLRYEVDFRSDGQQFMTFVKALKDKALIRLEERSKGFQWFFSFDLMLMHETKGTLKDCVILIDEPGLHLHPAAQVDLLDRLTEYAQENTLIYTTHLPFMIDLKHPERIRLVSETPQGTVVRESLTDAQAEAKLVLQAALAIGGRTSYSVAEQNLVVEGLDDYWILTALSDLSLRSNKAGLPPDLLLTPAGGLSQLIYIATFLLGQNLEVIALFDTDKAGNAARDQFVKGWLSRYKQKRANALSLGPALGVSNKEYSIEDLFPEDFYISCVEEVYGKQLGASRANLKTLPAGEQLVKRVEKFFEAASVPFNKGAVCKVLCKKIRGMKNVSELRSSTVSLIEVLFENIRKEFAAFQPRQS